MCKLEKILKTRIDIDPELYDRYSEHLLELATQYLKPGIKQVWDIDYALIHYIHEDVREIGVRYGDATRQFYAAFYKMVVADLQYDLKAR